MILTQEDYNRLTTITGVLMLSQLRPPDAFMEHLKAQTLTADDMNALAENLSIMRVNVERAVFTLDDANERRAAIDTIHWCCDAAYAVRCLAEDP